MGLTTKFNPLGGSDSYRQKVHINITQNILNYNVYTELEKLGLTPDTVAYDVIINLASGVIIGSAQTYWYAFASGGFKAGTLITLNIMSGAYITGAGGTGGTGGTYNPYSYPSEKSPSAGTIGGPAMHLLYPITINNLGTIQSGGQGGTGGIARWDTSDMTNSGEHISGAGGQGGDGTGYASGNGSVTSGGAGRVGSTSCWSYLGCVTGNTGNVGGAAGSDKSIVHNNNAITWINQGTIKGTISATY